MGRYFAVFVAAALLGSSPATEAAPKTPGQMKRAEQAERALKLLGYHEVPEEIHPVAGIEFPSARPGEDPIRLRVELTERC